MSPDAHAVVAAVAVAYGLARWWSRASARAAERTVLELLADGHEWYGLALVKASAGRLKRGTVHVTLGRMEDRGLVAGRDEDDAAPHIGIRRRLYRITVLGQRELRER